MIATTREGLTLSGHLWIFNHHLMLNLRPRRRKTEAGKSLGGKNKREKCNGAKSGRNKGEKGRGRRKVIKNKSYIMLKMPAIKPLPSKDRSLPESKETTLERADFTLQQLMFVKRENIVYTFLSFFPVFVHCCPRNFKLGQAECVQTMKALTNRPGSQLFLMKFLYPRGLLKGFFTYNFGEKNHNSLIRIGNHVLLWNAQVPPSRPGMGEVNCHQLRNGDSCCHQLGNGDSWYQIHGPFERGPNAGL